MVQDTIGVCVGNAEIPFVGLAFDQIGRRRLGHDLLGYSDVAGERPHLCLEQVAERIDRRRVVTVPSEVAEQAL